MLLCKFKCHNITTTVVWIIKMFWHFIDQLGITGAEATFPISSSCYCTFQTNTNTREIQKKATLNAAHESDWATEAVRVDSLMSANTDYPAFTEAADFLSRCPQDFCQRALVSPRNDKQPHTEKKAARKATGERRGRGRNVTCVLSQRRRWSQ